MTPETKLKNEVAKYLDSLGSDCWWFKVVASQGQKAGVPDIVGCYKGRFFAIENKSKDGKLSKKQEHEIKKIKLAGGQTATPRCLDEAKCVFYCMESLFK